MPQIRKMVKYLEKKKPDIEDFIDTAEANGIEIIRIKSRKKSKYAGPKLSSRIIYGFDVYSTRRGRGKFIPLSSTTVYPSNDSHFYAYIPKTDVNLKLLASWLHNGAYLADEPDVKIEVEALAKELEFSIEYEEMTFDIGNIASDERRRVDKKTKELDKLLKAIENKKLDDKIREAEAELNAENKIVVEPEIVVEDLDVVEPEIIIEEQKKRSLSKVKTNRK